jgi:Brp/Blh family beta-carotene 15,15'-monooxygenase
MGEAVRHTIPSLIGLALAGGLLVLLPPSATLVAAFVLVAIVGLPHGASDTALARPRWQAWFGGAWLAAFLAAYLGTALVAFVFWISFPVTALALFLIVSAAHFGHDDLPSGLADGRGAGTPAGWARGLFVLGAPALFWRAEVAAIFAALLPADEAGAAEVLASLLQAIAVPAALASILLPRMKGAGDNGDVSFLRSALVLVPFPPLVGFPLYFAAVHSARQMRRRTEALGLRSRSDYLLTVWPYALGGVGVMTLAGLALTGVPDRLLATLFIGLATLTVPHILFGHAPQTASVTTTQQQTRETSCA